MITHFNSNNNKFNFKNTLRELKFIEKYHKKIVFLPIKSISKYKFFNLF